MRPEGGLKVSPDKWYEYSASLRYFSVSETPQTKENSWRKWCFNISLYMKSVLHQTNQVMFHPTILEAYSRKIKKCFIGKNVHFHTNHTKLKQQLDSCQESFTSRTADSVFHSDSIKKEHNQEAVTHLTSEQQRNHWRGVFYCFIFLAKIQSVVPLTIVHKFPLILHNENLSLWTEFMKLMTSGVYAHWMPSSFSVHAWPGV